MIAVPTAAMDLYFMSLLAEEAGRIWHLEAEIYINYDIEAGGGHYVKE